MTFEEKKKILVVDDEEDWLTTIKNVLQSDYDLVLEISPSEALKIFGENSFSLVILDMKFPDGTQGTDLFSQMQKISPGLRAIILTGFPDLDDALLSWSRGVLAYLKKGSDNLFSELKDKVREILENKEESEILSLITRGEDEELEFKSSARWDFRGNKVNKDLEKVIIKTVAAFLNSERGGILLIGVDDNGNIIGLQPDYDTLGKKNRDGYETYLNDLLLNVFGKDLSLFLNITFHQIERKDICRVVVKSSPRPIFVIDDKSEHLYIRTGNSTRLLSTREAIEYSKNRWNK